MGIQGQTSDRRGHRSPARGRQPSPSRPMAAISIGTSRAPGSRATRSSCRRRWSRSILPLGERLGPHTPQPAPPPRTTATGLHWVMGALLCGYVGDRSTSMVPRLTLRCGGSCVRSSPRSAAVGSAIWFDDGNLGATARAGCPRHEARPAHSRKGPGGPIRCSTTSPIPTRIDCGGWPSSRRSPGEPLGFAFATASALPMTVERIAAWAARAEGRGIRLAPVSAALATPRGG